MYATQKTITYDFFDSVEEVDRYGSKIAALVDMYLDYSNNFLSVAAFAEHLEITLGEADHLINLGRAIHIRMNSNGRLGSKDAAHLYDVETCCGVVEIYADSRAQARKIAEQNDHVVRSVNMTA